METTIKVLSTVLILFSLFMGFKHGTAMALGKPDMIALFGKWDISKTAVQLLGIFGLLGTVFLIFPKTFVWGNLMTAALILFMMVQFLSTRDLKGFLVELPFLVLPLVLIYLRHPWARQ